MLRRSATCQIVLGSCFMMARLSEQPFEEVEHILDTLDTEQVSS